jgi:hypothetical protein
MIRGTGILPVTIRGTGILPVTSVSLWNGFCAIAKFIPKTITTYFGLL